MRTRLAVHPLFCLILAACGSPGSESVFTRNNPKTASLDSVGARPRTEPQRMVTRQYSGYYSKLGDDSQFQPCGTTVPLDVTGAPIARGILKERFRWNAVWEGAKMYAVFEGAIVTDTAATAGDSVKGPRTRFFLIDVDSLRTWRNGDCNGMKLPRPEQ